VNPPESAKFIDHCACSTVVTRSVEAGVDLVLAVVSMETMGAVAAVLLVANQFACTTILAGVGIADVALGHDSRVTLLRIKYIT